MIEFLEWLFFNRWISASADWLSLVGTGMTVYLFFTIRAIRRKYALLGRGPALTQELADRATVIIECRKDIATNLVTLNDHVIHANAALYALREFVGLRQRRAIKRALKAIELYDRDGASSKTTSDVYSRITAVTAEMRVYLEGRPWQE